MERIKFQFNGKELTLIVANKETLSNGVIKHNVYFTYNGRIGAFANYVISEPFNLRIAFLRFVEDVIDTLNGTEDIDPYQEKESMVFDNVFGADNKCKNLYALQVMLSMLEM